MAEKTTLKRSSSVKFLDLFCSVPDCKDHALSKSIGIPSHNFPVNEHVRKLWIRAIRNPRIAEDMPFKELKKFHVCGKHFKPSDYEVDTKFMLAPHLYKEKKILKKKSVPSIFLPITVVPQPSSNAEEIFLDEAITSSVYFQSQPSQVIYFLNWSTFDSFEL